MEWEWGAECMVAVEAVMDAAAEPAGTNPGFKPKSNQEGGHFAPLSFLCGPIIPKDMPCVRIHR